MPTIKTKRPRLRGALHKYEPFNLTEFIAKMHAASTMIRLKEKVRGAFGNGPKATRAARAAVKTANPVGSPL